MSPWWSGEISCTDVLPAKRLTVRLLLDTSGDNSRKLLFEYPVELAYLLESVK